MNDPRAPQAGNPALVSCVVQRWEAGACHADEAAVAEEVPVALVYGGLSYAVMMASPGRLEDFAIGFSLTEGIVAGVGEIRGVRVASAAEGLEVHVDIPLERYLALESRRRNLSGRTGCGLCGTRTLEEAVRNPAPLPAAAPMRIAALLEGLRAMEQGQSLNRATGATHAAAWVGTDGVLRDLCEDVGRHIALDKLLGAMAQRGNDRAGAVLVTSRASFEMVQKCAVVRMPVLAAISAPTALAVRIAQRTGLALVGFARGTRATVYSGSERLLP